jgi:ADP-heptose:LPS heptosyltransferase
MMHIGAALKKKIISFWGCTKPSQGFRPYLNFPEPVEIIYSPYSRPCSKHGKFCKTSNNGCVKKIKTDKIVKVIKKVLKIS